VPRLRAILVTAGIFCLTGCHADVTQRLSINPDHTVTLTYREVLDAAMYLAATKTGGSDPFRMSLAKASGWTVSEDNGPNGEHIFTYVKSAPSTQVNALTFPRSHNSDGFNFGPAIAFPYKLRFDSSNGPTSVPALLNPGNVLQRPGHNPDGAAAEANALRNAEAVDAVVDAHFEIKALWRGMKTNGKTMPDGSIRWDLHFSKPTSVQYALGASRLQFIDSERDVAAGAPDKNDPSTPPAPRDADWSAVYASSFGYADSPLAAWQSIGTGGTYDFSRWGDPSGRPDEKYRPASKFAIGVYWSGSGLPEPLLDATMQLID